MDKLERVAQIVQAEIFAFNDGGWGVDDDAAKAIAARILAALEPVTPQEAARVLLANMHHCKPHGTHGRPGATVERIHFGPYAVRSLRALAERGE